VAAVAVATGRANEAASGISFEEVIAAASRFEGEKPVEVLSWAARRFPGEVVFATGFGSEGCVLVDVIARAGLPIDLVTLDTGLLFDETYVLWSQLEAKYGIKIRAIRPEQTVVEQARTHGDRLWEREPDRCCALRKVAPLEEALAGRAAWIAAIRRDQTRERAGARAVEFDLRRPGLLKINPLLAWTAADVQDYVRRHDVPTNPLHAQGYPSIGCEPCTSPVAAGEDPRAGRWRGREKKECGLHAVRPVVSTPVLSSEPRSL
jgi:phosphoadenylyl-sulfate reductase (thioredoxin)